MEDDFLELMGSTVVWKKLKAHSADGFSTPTYHLGRKLRCHLRRTTRMVRTIDGDEKTAQWQVSLFGAPGVGVEDQIVLPDETTPPILTVDLAYDEYGHPYNEVVYLG